MLSTLREKGRLKREEGDKYDEETTAENPHIRTPDRRSPQPGIRGERWGDTDSGACSAAFSPIPPKNRRVQNFTIWVRNAESRRAGVERAERVGFEPTRLITYSFSR